LSAALRRAARTALGGRAFAGWAVFGSWAESALAACFAIFSQTPFFIFEFLKQI
jgi:hypothetical protein